MATRPSSSFNRVPTPLYYAASFGLTEVAQLLLDSGADVNAQSGPAGCSLAAASLAGHVETVQLLLDRGADIEAPAGLLGGNALLLATTNGHREVVRLLLERGANVNAEGASDDDDGATALQEAAYRGDREIVRSCCSTRVLIGMPVGDDMALHCGRLQREGI
ncbi:hypothetical protein VTN96DRAFT_1403 [Rasamsonia emersonii]